MGASNHHSHRSGQSEPRSPFATGLRLALVFLLLFALSCAISPSLHHWLHGDEADEPQHQCLALTMEIGKLDVATNCTLFAYRPEIRSPEVPLNFSFIAPIQRQYPLPPERAPPSAA